MSEEITTDLTVVVPVQSVEVEFEEILEQYGREFDQRGIDYEFVFVLDGTPDSLFDDLARRRPADKSVRIIKFNQRFGESIALSSGFKIARGAVILSLPEYIQTAPQDVHHVLDAIEDRGADVVTCWRKPRIDSILYRIQSFLFNLLMRLLTRARFHDLNCLHRAMRRRVFEDVTVQGDMYRFLPVLAHRAGYEVSEVVVRHLKERSRTGFGIGVYIRRFLDISALLFLTRFTRKPLRFFGLAGGGIFFIGLMMCAWLLIQHFSADVDQERLKNKTQLVLGVLLLVLGVQTFFIGLVAEIIIFIQGRNLKDYRIGRVVEGSGPVVGQTPPEPVEKKTEPGGSPAAKKSAGKAHEDAA